MSVFICGLRNSVAPPHDMSDLTAHFVSFAHELITAAVCVFVRFKHIAWRALDNTSHAARSFEQLSVFF